MICFLKRAENMKWLHELALNLENLQRKWNLFFKLCNHLILLLCQKEKKEKRNQQKSFYKKFERKAIRSMIETQNAAFEAQILSRKEDSPVAAVTAQNATK